MQSLVSLWQGDGKMGSLCNFLTRRRPQFPVACVPASWGSLHIVQMENLPGTQIHPNYTCGRAQTLYPHLHKANAEANSPSRQPGSI